MSADEDIEAAAAVDADQPAAQKPHTIRNMIMLVALVAFIVYLQVHAAGARAASNAKLSSARLSCRDRSRCRWAEYRHGLFSQEGAHIAGRCHSAPTRRAARASIRSCLRLRHATFATPRHVGANGVEAQVSLGQECTLAGATQVVSCQEDPACRLSRQQHDHWGMRRGRLI